MLSPGGIARNKVRLTVDSGVLQKPPVTGEVLDSACHSLPSPAHLLTYADGLPHSAGVKKDLR